MRRAKTGFFYKASQPQDGRFHTFDGQAHRGKQGYLFCRESLLEIQPEDRLVSPLCFFGQALKTVLYLVLAAFELDPVKAVRARTRDHIVDRDFIEVLPLSTVVASRVEGHFLQKSEDRIFVFVAEAAQGFAIFSKQPEICLLHKIVDQAGFRVAPAAQSVDDDVGDQGLRSRYELLPIPFIFRAQAEIKQLPDWGFRFFHPLDLGCTQSYSFLSARLGRGRFSRSEDVADLVIKYC